MSICVILSDDMIDLSRIGGHARGLGLEVLLARNQTQAVSHLSKQPAALLVDLHQSTLQPELLMATIKSQSSRTHVVGYGSHVDVNRLKQARAAGLDLVLPRSAFFTDIDANISRWCGLTTGTEPVITESH